MGDDRVLLCQAGRLPQAEVSSLTRLFLGRGENGTPSMIAKLELLEARFAAQPLTQRKVINRRFPKRDHYNVLPDAFVAGVQALLG
jgi:hypothetical protein